MAGAVPGGTCRSGPALPPWPQGDHFSSRLPPSHGIPAGFGGQWAGGEEPVEVLPALPGQNRFCPCQRHSALLGDTGSRARPGSATGLQEDGSQVSVRARVPRVTTDTLAQGTSAEPVRSVGGWGHFSFVSCVGMNFKYRVVCG